MDLKGSKTEKNLLEAFAGESQARNKYSYYASKAKKEGYEKIAAIFEETANNEKEHAKMWFKLLNGIGPFFCSNRFLIAFRRVLISEYFFPTNICSTFSAKICSTPCSTFILSLGTGVSFDQPQKARASRHFSNSRLAASGETV